MKSGYYYINVTANFTDKAEEVDECPQGEIILHHRDGVSFAKLTPANHINCADCPTKETFEKLVSLPDCNECGALKNCIYKPRVGDPVRNNCPLWRPLNEEEAKG